MRRGVWLFPAVEAPRLVDAIVTAEAAGLDEVWLGDEGVAREPLAVLAAAAMRTERITLAVGISPLLLRHPGAIAATAATIDELAPGRVVLGVGIGGALALGPFGIDADRPVATLRTGLDIARAVLERRPTDGYEPPPHAMAARTVPLWVGARGPQLLRVAATAGDGIFVSGCTRPEHDEIIGAARARNRRVGVALYQSAAEDDPRPTVQPWSDIASHLRAEAARFRPDSIGINLVETARGADPVGLVERAARILTGPIGP